MVIEKLISVLEENKEPLYIMLPTGEFVPEHFHITEVGKIDKKFIDCGGVFRENVSCSLQIWIANDLNHRLTAEKLCAILKMAKEKLSLDSLLVEIEYGADPVSYYKLYDVELTPRGLLFLLQDKKTQCLAPDKCGIKGCC